MQQPSTAELTDTLTAIQTYIKEADQRAHKTLAASKLVALLTDEHLQGLAEAQGIKWLAIANFLTSASELMGNMPATPRQYATSFVSLQQKFVLNTEGKLLPAIVAALQTHLIAETEIADFNNKPLVEQLETLASAIKSKFVLEIKKVLPYKQCCIEFAVALMGYLMEKGLRHGNHQGKINDAKLLITSLINQISDSTPGNPIELSIILTNTQRAIENANPAGKSDESKKFETLLVKCRDALLPVCYLSDTNENGFQPNPGWNQDGTNMKPVITLSFGHYPTTHAIPLITKHILKDTLTTNLAVACECLVGYLSGMLVPAKNQRRMEAVQGIVAARQDVVFAVNFLLMQLPTSQQQEKKALLEQQQSELAPILMQAVSVLVAFSQEEIDTLTFTTKKLTDLIETAKKLSSITGQTKEKTTSQEELVAQLADINKNISQQTGPHSKQLTQIIGRMKTMLAEHQQEQTKLHTKQANETRVTMRSAALIQLLLSHHDAKFGQTSKQQNEKSTQELTLEELKVKNEIDRDKIDLKPLRDDDLKIAQKIGGWPKDLNHPTTVAALQAGLENSNSLTKPKPRGGSLSKFFSKGQTELELPEYSGDETKTNDGEEQKNSVT